MNILLVGSDSLTPTQLEKHIAAASSIKAEVVTCTSNEMALYITANCPIDMVIAHLGAFAREGYDLLRQIKINKPKTYTMLVGNSEDLHNSVLDKSYIDEYFCLPQFETILMRANRRPESGQCHPPHHAPASAPQPSYTLSDFPQTQRVSTVATQPPVPLFPSVQGLSRLGSRKNRGQKTQSPQQEPQIGQQQTIGQQPTTRQQQAEEMDTEATGFSFVRLLGNIAFGFLMVVMAIMAFLMVQSKIIGEPPSIAGYQMFVVVSGSMSPAFDTGSLVFAKSLDPMGIVAGDIITFKGASNDSMLTTHRVVHVNTEGGLNFTTRGDANNVNDPNPVSADRVVGKVHGSLPFLGYVLGFAQTRQGLVFLIFIPGLLVIVYELRNILKYIMEDKKLKTEGEGATQSA